MLKNISLTGVLRLGLNGLGGAIVGIAAVLAWHLLTLPEAAEFWNDADTLMTTCTFSALVGLAAGVGLKLWRGDRAGVSILGADGNRAFAYGCLSV